MSELFDTLFLFGKSYCATLAIGFVCAYLGLYCVLRRIVFTGVALAQLAAAGVAGAFFLADRGLGPISRFASTYGATWGSLGMSLLGVLGLELRSKKQGSATPDALVGVAYAASSAIAILLVWRSSRGLTELQNILAGEVLLTGEGELVSLWLGLGAVTILHLVLRREFLLVSFDPEFARAQGLNERRFQLLLLASLAVAVALSLKAGGLLLVFAFLVLPPVAGLSIARGLEHAALFSVLTAGAASLLGFLLAIGADWPVGPTVSVCLLGFVVLFRAAKLHPTAQAAARWTVGGICGLALVLAPVSILAGPSEPSEAPEAPAPTVTTADDGHGHAPATGGIDVSIIEKTLLHGTPEERLRVLNQLEEEGGSWALQPLLGALLDDEPSIRAAVQDAVVAVCERDPRAPRMLANYRNHPVPELRLSAALLLHHMERPQAKTALVECLVDGELPPFHRLELLDTLTAITGDDYGYDPFAEEPEANAEALARWRSWAKEGGGEELAAAPEDEAPSEPFPMGDGHDHSHGRGPPMRTWGSLPKPPKPAAPARPRPKDDSSLDGRLRSRDARVVAAAEAELRGQGAAALPMLTRLLAGEQKEGWLGRVDPSIPARVLVALGSPQADEVLENALRSNDTAAALAVIRSLDLVRHRGLLQASAQGRGTTEERRVAVGRLAKLDDPGLRPLMQMCAREGFGAASEWLGTNAPELALDLLKDPKLADQADELGQALIESLEAGVLGEFSDTLPKLMDAAEPSQSTAEILRPLASQAQLLRDLESAPTDLQARVEKAACEMVQSRHRWDRWAGARLLRVVGRLAGTLTLLRIRYPGLNREALQACGARLTPDDLAPVLELLAETRVEETRIKGFVLLGPVASRVAASAPEAVAKRLGAWFAQLSPELRRRARGALVPHLPPEALALPDLIPHARAFVSEGTFFEGGMLTADPRSALRALVLSEDPRGLEPALRAVHVTTEDPTLGAEVHQSARVALARLLQDHPSAATALAQRLWTQGPGSPVDGNLASALEAAVEQLEAKTLALPSLRGLRRVYLSRQDEPSPHVVESLVKAHDAADLPIVLERLTARGDDAVEAAWSALCAAYPQEARELTARTLRTGPPDRRLALARRLDAIPGVGALVFPLWPTLSPEVRDAAAESLLKDDDPRTTAGLAARYDALTLSAREGLLKRIADEADPAQLPVVGRSLRSRHPQVRARAQEALTALKARARSLETLKRLTAQVDTTDQLLELLQSDEPRVVLGAVRALGILRSKRALPDLVRLLERADPDLQRAVLDAIERCGGSAPP